MSARLFLAGVYGAIAFVSNGCPPAPTPPTPDAGPSPAPSEAGPPPAPGSAGAACAALAAAGCAEGAAPTCSSTLQKMAANRTTTINVACLGACTSKASCRACGGVACP